MRKTKRRLSKKTGSPKKRATHSPFKHGAEGFETGRKRREAQDKEYEKRKNTPFDFRLKPGEETTVIVLDKGDPFFVTLHKIKTAQGRWVDEVCIADTGVSCPLCESTGKEGSYTLVLTVLDRRKYTVKNGPNAGKVIKLSKKLAKVKSRNLPKFERQYKKRSSFANLKVLCRRSGDKEAAIGEDLEFLGVVKDSVMSRYNEYKGAADYAEIFAPLTADEMRQRYRLAGARPVAGGEEFSKNSGDEYDLDDIPF